MTTATATKPRRQSAKAIERAEAIAKLRDWIKPGDTVYTILDHVSASGMSRAIRVVLPTITGEAVESVAPGGQVTDYVRRDRVGVDFLHPNWAVGRALDIKHWKRNGREQDALMVGGCGMDMGFHLVYELSSVLDGREGYACLGKGRCPSNYHSNHRNMVTCDGTRVYNPDGPDTGERCYRPSMFSRYPVPADWPRRVVDIGDGETVEAGLQACIETPADDGTGQYVVCPTCHGAGELPNPDGPERFDLVHTDGYALRHKWL